MAPIAFLPLDHPTADASFWPAFAQQVQAGLGERGLAPRDAVVLLPYAQLLPLARRAFARAGGWQPRIETTQTLAAALGPGGDAAGGPSFDVTLDRLVAAQMLRDQPGLAAWSRRDPRAFDQAVARVADTAQALLRSLLAVAPAQRPAWIEAARRLLGPVVGPGATERALARAALEWALLGDTTAVDRLHALRPSCWLLLRCGGHHALAESLLAGAAAQGVPGLVIDADGDGQGGRFAPRRLVCPGFEDEAMACADAVLQAVDEGRRPVALIAQDRMLVRRVRALLERSQLRLRDETGWTLSTTRRAAQVMALLRAAGDAAALAGGRITGAVADRWLDWLKCDAMPPPRALAALEAAWRRDRPPEGEAAGLLEVARERLRPLGTSGARSLADWLAALRAALLSDGNRALFESDPAGQQLLAALRLSEDAQGGAWRALAHDTRMDAQRFRAWVDGVLEQQSFLPPPDEHADEPDVVITPSGRALLRPFGRIVFGGTDERRLGGGGVPDPLLPDALCAPLGLESAAERRAREGLALAQLLRVRDVVLLRRGSEDGETLSASPLIERVLRGLQRGGIALEAEQAASPTRARVPRDPVARPAPPAAQALPSRLSASTVQALRDCPYRFFSRAVLRLGEQSELDAELEKRDYGSWLHAVLLQFHREREAPRSVDGEVEHLKRAADALQQSLRVDPAQLLPFRAAFAAWAPAYAAWLHGRDAQGWQWLDGERWAETRPEALPGLTLHGRIDRLDRLDHRPATMGGSEAVVQLIDYKTGSLQALRALVREPFEDTQLAFYAALMAATPEALGASYLVLDERKGPTEVPHEAVQASAQALLEGLAGEWERLRAGAGLPALGEGLVCETCEARGLCRRDHWSEAA